MLITAIAFRIFKEYIDWGFANVLLLPRPLKERVNDSVQALMEKSNNLRAKRMRRIVSGLFQVTTFACRTPDHALESCIIVNPEWF